ncbi:MAG: STAS-like domain-containing protein [Planctomycetes bacterium]|nr:STAS-like domain-containing protein [Planctomycetota bacterium]
MVTLRVNDILTDKILVSRESAHLLEDPLNAMMAAAKTPGNPTGTTSMVVDFEGIEGMAPSFLDELISIFESIIESETDSPERRLVVANPPTRLSLKFEAVARGHGMSVEARSDGSWLLTPTAHSAT